MNTTHNTKTKLLAKAVGVAAAAMFSGGLALAGLGLASGVAQAAHNPAPQSQSPGDPDSCGYLLMDTCKDSL